MGILNASSGRLWCITLHPHAAWGAWKTPFTRQHDTENLTFVKLFLINILNNFVNDVFTSKNTQRSGRISDILTSKNTLTLSGLLIHLHAHRVIPPQYRTLWCHEGLTKRQQGFDPDRLKIPLLPLIMTFFFFFFLFLNLYFSFLMVPNDL